MATYYVKTGGNDEADGLSDGNAWATLAKVHATELSAGDTVSLNRGDRWREILYIDYAGTEGSPITYTAYGSGALPAICGANLITGWTIYSGNIYQAACTTEPKVVIFDGTTGTNVDTPGECTQAYQWCWTSNVLYTYAASDPDGLYTSPGIEAATRGWGITTGWTAGKNYITLENLRVYGVNEGPAIFSTRASNWTVSGVTVEQCGRTGVQMRSATSHTITGCTLTGVRALNPGWRGVYFYYESGSYPGSGNTVTLSTITQWGGYGVHFIGYGPTYRTSNVTCTYNDLSHNGTGCYVSYADTGTVAYNTCDDNVAGGDSGVEEYGVALQTASSINVHHNTITDGRVGIEVWAGTTTSSPTGGASDDNTIHHNQISGNTEKGLMAERGNTDNNQFYTNLIYDNGYAGISIADANAGYESTGCVIYNNTLFCNNTRGAGYADIYFGSVAAGWTVKNNILYNIDFICLRRGGSTLSATHSSNCYYRASGTVVQIGTTNYTLAQVSTFEPTARAADPLFTSTAVGAEDFRLTAGSPCIDAGEDVGLTTDYLDLTFS